MEPTRNNENAPGVELPGLGMPEAYDQLPASPEIRGQTPVDSAKVSSVMPSSPSPVPSVQPSDPSQGAYAPTGSSSISAGLTADDADLIEKEWVLKAKAIVMHTRSDPRAQNIQINGIKADYLKKRYNKDLKVSET